MFADKALRCDCGYEVRASDEEACVAEVRRHAWEEHGVDFTVELALQVVRRAEVVPSSERNENGLIREEKR